MQSSRHTLYYVTFSALLVLLAVTVGVSFLELGAWAAAAAMTVAVAKTVLIVLYFMHVRYEVPLVRVFVIAGFLWLVILLTFLMSDYLTREGVTSARSASVENFRNQTIST